MAPMGYRGVKRLRQDGAIDVKKGGLARPEESLTALNRLNRIWQLADFRL
jgi:hypothetical protein